MDDLKRLELQRDMDLKYTLYEEKESVFALDVKIDFFGKEPQKLITVKGGDDDKDVNEKTRNYRHTLNKTMQQGDSFSFKLDKLPSETLNEMDKTLLPLTFEMISEERREGELPEDYFKHQNLLPELKIEVESTHIADVYLPRTVAIVRHSAA